MTALEQAESIRAIASVLSKYFDALFDSDARALADVLHPQAMYCTPTTQPATFMNLESYLPVVAARASPRSKAEPRRDSIERIELAGPQVASARVRCAIGDKHYIDLLTLIQTEGRWQIVSKVFHFDQPIAPPFSEPMHCSQPGTNHAVRQH